MLNKMFKSIIDQDRAAVVICDTEHRIVYMNPAAILAYAKRGGAELVGRDLRACHNPDSVNKIQEVLSWFEKSADNNMVHTFYNEKQNKDVYMIALRDAEGRLLGYYEKHEYRDIDKAPFYDIK